MAATIKDISRLTNLGAATISAYLNGVKVRPHNKEAIESAINQLGYVRNEYARGLKTHKSMTIGVLIPELNNVFSTSIISQMEEVLRAHGYGVIVCDCQSNLVAEEKSLLFLLSKMVDGLIIMPISTDGKVLHMALERNIPTLVIDRMTDCKDVSYVLIDNQEVSFNAVKHLLDNGHRNIALITGDKTIYTARERREGYKKATKEFGCYDNSKIYDGKLSIEGGYLAMKDIVEQQREVTALFVTNYEMTIGAIIAINELGKKIPNDYSFVGFDNQELSKVFSPRLATVCQPLSDIGRSAASKLISIMDGGERSTIVLNAEFFVGESIKTI